MIYIISYPRSGNTAFRYIIELITGKPTNGLCGVPNPKDNLQQPLIHQRTDFIAHKQHDFRGVHRNDFVFFIVRHPLEAVIRHNKKHRGVAFEQMKGYLNSWLSLLNDYDSHDGNKMLIYYEELIKISFQESREIYRNPQSDSLTFHRRNIPFHEQKKLMDYIKENPLYSKYLSRYEYE